MKYTKGLLEKLSELDFHVNALPDDRDESNVIYLLAGKLYDGYDTHYIMKGSDVVFIGNVSMLNGFVNSQHLKLNKVLTSTKESV